jgi:hypothetical protein
VGIIAQKIKEEIDKFIQIVSEHRKDFRQNALLYTPAGDDSVPLNEERLILVKVDGTGRYVAVGTLTPSQGAKPGEKIFFARDPDGTIVSKLSMLHGGHINFTQDGNAEIKIKGSKEENVTGKAKHTSADTDIVSIAPVGINDGLYKTGLSPYLTAETSAATALQSAASAAAAQLAILDALSGAAGTITGLGAAINSFCAAMISADSSAHSSISKAVK